MQGKNSAYFDDSKFNMPQLSQGYVVDANFFISLKDVHQFHILTHLKDLIQRKNLFFFTTNRIFNEVHPLANVQVLRDDFIQVKNFLRTYTISEEEINDVKMRIGKNPPQDPDVSAIALAEKLSQKFNSVEIISCDFKLQEKADLLGFDVITPSAFLKTIANVTSGQLKEAFKIASNRVYKYELQYAYDQAEIYQEGEKITWIKGLMADVTIGSPTPPEDLTQKYLRYIKKYIEGKKLPGKLPDDITNAFSLINPLRETYPEHSKVKSFIKQQRFNEAIDLLHDILKRIHLGAFVCLNKKKEKLEEDIASLYFDTLAHLEFGIGKCHLYDGDVESCFEHLIQSALFSQLAQQLEEALTTQLHLGKIYLYSRNWSAARSQFETVYHLSKEIDEVETPPECLIGLALVLKAENQDEKGSELFNDAITLLEQDLRNASIILGNFADFIFSSGYSEWALHLYYRALEYAVEAKKLEYSEKLFNKLYKSIFGTGKSLTALYPILDKLIHLANELNKQDIIPFFDTEKERIKKIEEMVTQPFPFFTSSGKEWELGNEIPSAIKYDLELLYIENLDASKSLLVCYSPNLGNIGIILPSEVKSNLGYTALKLNDDGQYKVEDPPETLKKSFFLRAIVQAKEFNDVKFQKFRPLVEFEL